jgi:hypothetical protein
MAIHVCTYEDLMLNKIELKLPSNIRLVCPYCNKQFQPPRFTDSGIIGCPFCGHEDSIRK